MAKKRFHLWGGNSTFGEIYLLQFLHRFHVENYTIWSKKVRRLQSELLFSTTSTPCRIENSLGTDNCQAQSHSNALYSNNRDYILEWKIVITIKFYHLGHFIVHNCYTFLRTFWRTINFQAGSTFHHPTVKSCTAIAPQSVKTEVNRIEFYLLGISYRILHLHMKCCW